MQMSNGRRASSRRLPAFLRNWRILYCVIIVLLALLLVSSFTGRKAGEDRDAALSTIETLNGSIAQLETEKAALESEIQRQAGLVLKAQEENTKLARAMDIYWQIDEAYALGRHDRARNLIQILEGEALAGVLPTESTTDNGRFSPFDRYQEINAAVN